MTLLLYDIEIFQNNFCHIMFDNDKCYIDTKGSHIFLN